MSPQGELEEAVAEDMKWMALTRAWSTHDVHILRKLWPEWEEARSIVQPVGSDVRPNDGAALEANFATAVQKALAAKAAFAENAAQRTQGKHKAFEKRLSAGARRLAQLWRPKAYDCRR